MFTTEAIEESKDPIQCPACKISLKHELLVRQGNREVWQCPNCEHVHGCDLVIQ